jgi:lauroyl/myristoyl acyltransferase
MQEESLLPIQWEDDPTTLERHLRNGARVLAAFDDRAFQRWTPLRLLGRPATLSEDPWIAARNADTPVIPCFFLRERDKTWRVDLGAPYRGTLPDWLRLQAEPWLQRHPGAYAMWLAECRIRKKMDDHPFFLDYPGSATGLD